MWSVHVDEKHQTIQIESRSSTVIAMSLPYTRFPNPGRDVLMGHPDNRKCWDSLDELVRAANKGRRKGENDGHC